jgi:hypothetical protein
VRSARVSESKLGLGVVAGNVFSPDVEEERRAEREAVAIPAEEYV